MPIKPENKGRYPKNWKEIRQQILQRANNRCESAFEKLHKGKGAGKIGSDKDLWWFVEKKMRYNELRPWLNWKKY